MKYLEIAYGSPSSRGTLISQNTLPNYLQKAINEGVALYRSTYIYGEDALEFSKENNSIKGFVGNRAIDNIILDVDKADNSDNFTLSVAQSICMELKDGDIPFRPFFSGTGYHILIPNKVFDFKKSKDLPYIVKNTIKNIFPDIDHSILMRSGIYRVVSTINKKSGLRKIPLYKKELFDFNTEQIKELAKGLREDYWKAPESMEEEGTLKSFIIEEVPEIRTLSSFPEPVNVVSCVQKMFHEGPQQGQRHKTVLRMASHFMRNGIPSDIAKAGILLWNNNMLENEEIMRIVEQVYKNKYRYSCNDVMMKEYCSTRCMYYKRKDYLIDVYSAEDLMNELDSRLSTDFTGRSINLAKMFNLNNVECIIYPGELVTIFGPTGSSKTTLAQNIALGYDFANDIINPDWQIPTLFLSLELSAWYMHRRNMQIVTGRDANYVIANRKQIWHQHKDELSHIVIQTVSPTIEQIQQKIRELNPSMVIVDYIDLVDTPFKDEYSQIRHISHSLSNLAVNLDIIIIQLSQVSREYSRREAMDLYAGKGSGAIENASRKVLGIDGAANKSLKDVRLLKNSDGSLFDTTLEWTPSFRLRKVTNDK